MTREEAKEELNNYGYTINEQNTIVDKIYGHFESKTCENCKYNKQQDGFMIFCDKVVCKDGSRMMWHSYTKDFGCNKWEERL